MTNFSLAGAGWIVLLLSLVVNLLGLDMDEGQITEIANAIVLLIGFLTALVGQLRRKDLKMGLLRK